MSLGWLLAAVDVESFPLSIPTASQEVLYRKLTSFSRLLGFFSAINLTLLRLIALLILPFTLPSLDHPRPFGYLVTGHSIHPLPFSLRDCKTGLISLVSYADGEITLFNIGSVSARSRPSLAASS